MSAWKAFEREMAAAFDGARFWANSGEALDFTSAYAHGQCKLVKCLSLEALTQLAESIEAAALKTDRIGVVAVKVRRGKGRRSEPLIVLPLASWRRLKAKLPADLVGVESQTVVEGEHGSCG